MFAIRYFWQDFLEKDDDESDGGEEGGDILAHVGDKFYLYKPLYDKLYAHQRDGILFLWRLYRTRKGGILGDDMGSLSVA